MKYSHRPPTTCSEAKDRVLALIDETIGCKIRFADEEEIMNLHFFDDLGSDSLEVTSLCFQIEEEFNIQILDEEIEKIKTVKELITIILIKSKTITNDKDKSICRA